MARYYFPATELIVGTGVGTPAAVVLAPNAELTVWSAETGGTKYTDLKAADGTTALPTNGAGNPFADANGMPPDMWGPDGVREMWQQVGTHRTPMYPSTEMYSVLTSAARLTTANAFSGVVTFTSGTPVAFTTTPVVSGSTVVTAANLATQMALPAVLAAFLNATGQPYYIYINATTGVWPNSGARTIPTGFTGRVIWDSQGYIGALQPAGIIDGDFWDERVS